MIYTLQVTNDQTRMIRVAACECLKELELNFPVSKRSTHIITTYISIVFASMHVCVMSAHAGMCVHMCVCALMCVRLCVYIMKLFIMYQILHVWNYVYWLKAFGDICA